VQQTADGLNRNIRPNLKLLAHAIDQVGPWAGQSIVTTPKWFIEQLRETIRSIDWTTAKNDVQRFLPAREQDSLKLWDSDFFLYHADKLKKLFC
jgi:hypothetical protein